MSSQTGTLEVLLLELTKVLKPLKDRLTESQASIFFAELGIELTPQQVGTIIDPLIATTTNVGSLIDKSVNLSKAIGENEPNIFTIKSEAESVVNAIKGVINSLGQIEETIKGEIPGLLNEVADTLPEKILNYLLARYLERFAGVSSLLEFLGILNEEEFNKGSIDPNKPAYTISSFNFSLFNSWISRPGDQLKKLYKWGEDDFNGSALFEKLESILSKLNFPVIFLNNQNPYKLDLVIAEAIADVDSKGLAIKLKNNLSTGLQTFKGEGWEAEYKIEFNPPPTTQLTIKPDGSLVFKPPVDSDLELLGEMAFKLTVKKKTSEAYILIGQTGGSRLEVGEFLLNTGAKFEWNAGQKIASGNFKFEAAVNKCKIIIDSSSADGFLKNILPATKLEADFDLLLGVNSDSGFYIRGSSALEIDLPFHLQLGLVDFNGLTIGIKPKDGKIPIGIGANINASLGPIAVSVLDMGISAEFSLAENNSGKLGPLNFDIGFKPPKGIGISIDTGVVKGAGFLRLDPDKGEYSGGLELSIKNTIQVSAIGVINTKMPDGTDGFSLLIIISVQFSPGIALGMGFFLNGLGGMLGIHRTINIQALRDGVRNDALDHILFPANVVENMNTLLPQIKGIFPIQKDQFMMGLMAKITWGVPTLVSIEFGVAIEFSNPVRLAILGVLKVVLPTEEAPILRLQVNFIGIIDFDKGYLSFDASIYNSKILTFTLEGDMALRLNWGGTKAFLMTVGGFHPAFNPPKELNVPALKRLTLTILSGNPNLVLTAYFAVTSNTVQFGAKIDFKFEVSSFKVIGFLLFDVLFQFSPFKFIARIAAGLEVKMGSTTLFSINLDFELSGPTPWNARGTASFRILFLSVKVSFNVTWGEASQVIEPSIAVLPKILEALTIDENWTAALPANRVDLIALNEIPKVPGKIVLQPFGALKISQTVLPLNLEINKFGNNKPLDIKHADVGSFKLGGQSMQLEEIMESFAPAAFKELTDADKLMSASYTKEKGGVQVSDTSTLTVNYGINREVNYEVKISDFDPFPEPSPTVQLDMNWFVLMAKGGAAGKSSLAVEKKQKNFKLKNSTVVEEEKFVIVNHTNFTQFDPHNFSGGTQAEADDVLVEIFKNLPEMKGRLSVVPEYHLTIDV